MFELTISDSSGGLATRNEQNDSWSVCTDISLYMSTFSVAVVCLPLFVHERL